MVSGDWVARVGAGLVAINSENPPGRERDAASFFAERAAENGLKARVVDHGDGRASALVELEYGDGPVLVFNSHLDTVPAGPVERWSFHPFTTGVRDGFLHGRGAVDAKGCLASMLAALVGLKSEKLMGKVVLMAVADEEVSGLGSLSLMKHVERMDYVVVGEPSSLRLCVASRGRTEVALEFFGKPAHASMPRMGVNAVTAAAKASLRFAELEKGFGPRRRFVGNSSAVVTVFHGGLKANVVPDSAKMVVDVRTTGEMPEDVLRMVKRVAEKTVSKNVSVKASITSVIPFFAADPESRLVKACRAALSASGIRPVLTGFVAATDLNRMSRKQKIDGVVIGPGDLSLAHSFREKVAVKELVKAAEVYRKIAENLLNP